MCPFPNHFDWLPDIKKMKTLLTQDLKTSALARRYITQVPYCDSVHRVAPTEIIKKQLPIFFAFDRTVAIIAIRKNTNLPFQKIFHNRVNDVTINDTITLNILYKNRNIIS